MWLAPKYREVLNRCWPTWMPLAAIEREHDFMAHVETLEVLLNLYALGLVECERGGLLERRWRVTSAGLHAALENVPFAGLV